MTKKEIDKMVKAIRMTTKKACKNKKTALKFLIKAGIIKKYDMKIEQLEVGKSGKVGILDVELKKKENNNKQYKNTHKTKTNKQKNKTTKQKQKQKH